MGVCLLPRITAWHVTLFVFLPALNPNIWVGYTKSWSTFQRGFSRLFFFDVFTSITNP